VVSDKIGELSSPSLDLFVVRDYFRVKHILKKRARRGIGLEVLLADIRDASGLSVGKWFEHIIDLHKLCESINCQFLLSSGANSPREMISGRCFDSLLELCNIKPERYWRELEEWLETRNDKRCYIDAE
jgi:RNase P/RNase MRP subunit p30